MSQAAALLAADLSAGELFERLISLLAEHVEASVVFVALMQPDGRLTIEYFYDHGTIRRYPHIVVREEGARSLEVVRTAEIIWGNSPQQWSPGVRVPIDSEHPETDDTVSAIFVPMQAAGMTLGCLSVQSTHADAYDLEQVELVAAIGRYLAVAAQNKRLYDELQRSADVDPLTGLANHSRLIRELDIAVRTATSVRPVAAVMFNSVNFAMFNDLYGYAEGDTILRRIAQALQEVAGEGTIVGRFGGDVFLAVVAHRSKADVIAFVEQACARLRELTYSGVASPIPISIACGYALAPIDAPQRGDLVALCVHRTRLSRKQGGRPIGEDDIDAYDIHGAYAGIETIVEGLLDRDPYTRVHVVHVNAMAKRWTEYNLEVEHADLARLLQASLLHDVGKLLVSDRILVKPGSLTPFEYTTVQRHAEFGRNLLAPYPAYAEVAEIIGQHHERWDGLGYPEGLSGEGIHPIARAIAVIDAFSAMVLDRPYHRGIAQEAALLEVERCAGTQFDPEYVERFLSWRREGEHVGVA
ncbi:MAG: sensor domain-containing diguanylate cyclase/phosphohydrolase [Vulcanimicrobiaceae bacterium]